MRDFIAYAQFETFWNRIQPQTPFGRADHEAMTIHRSPADLEYIWDETEVALRLLEELEGDPACLSRILHHLKRLPRFPQVAKERFDEVEFFQFKKFLYNYKSLVYLVNLEVRRTFGFRYESEAFEQLLDTGRQSPESFFVSDSFSDALSEVRAEIQTVNEAIKALQLVRAEAIQKRWGLAFGDRAFLVVPRDLLGEFDEAGTLVMVEPFDETKITLRPLPCTEELRLVERRSLLSSQERFCEDEVLTRLSFAANRELENLNAYQEALTRFDLALAGARLAREFHLVRPRLHAGPVEMKGGRFLPCEELCRDLGTAYAPLEASFDCPATVIFGSNMGGKTVVLKTLAFLQLCTQAGLFVPAESFSTRLFQHFHYLGEGCSQSEGRGLSGFGFEIRRLVDAWATLSEPALMLFDEFARTTNSKEAEAILSAVVEALTQLPEVTALFSTHFHGVRRLSEARYLRMKGLDRQGLALARDAEIPLDARIRLIDEHMAFHLVPDNEAMQSADAIAVAELLGLPSGIAERATHYFEQAN